MVVSKNPAAKMAAPPRGVDASSVRWEYFYLTVLVVYSAAVFFQVTLFEENTDFSSAMQVLRYLCYLCTVVKILHDRWDKRQFALMLLLFVVGAIVAVQSDNRSGFFLFLMMAGSCHVDSRRILEVTCGVRMAVLALMVLLTETGAVEDYISDISERPRHFLGFSWVTYAPTAMLFIILSLIVIRRERMRIWEYVLLGLCSWWLYRMTNTRMAFLLSLMVLGLAFLMGFFVRRDKRTGRDRRGAGKIVVAVPAICCALAIWLHAAYSEFDPIMVKLNRLLTYRLQYGLRAIRRYGITLFGQPIGWSGFSRHPMAGEFNYVDSGYLQVLLEQGVVFLVIIVCLYTWLLYKACEAGDFYMMLSVIVVCVFCITEPRLTETIFNSFLLLPFADFRAEWIEGRQLSYTAEEVG
ncbi:MAG: hypothetical protein SOI56_04295 [Eubacteriales bacterium]|jgi:hypothetical protein